MNESIQPQEPYTEIWKDDLLRRRPEAEYLLRFLVGRCQLQARDHTKRSYVFNIDAEWGQGKSFFMRHFRDHIRAAKYPAVYIDAWHDDFTNEPFTAVMAAIDEFVQPHLKGNSGKAKALRKVYQNTKQNFGRISISLAAGAVKKGATKLFGAGVDETLEYIYEDSSTSSEASKPADDADKSLAEEVAEGVKESGNKEIEALLDDFSQKQIDRFKEAKHSLGAFRSNLSQFLEKFADAKGGQMRLPFFILVDELDRCRPTYAVEMLERIKHLFDVPNVVFVLSTNTEQLSHAIGAVYGVGFNSRAYLDRFFHRTYLLPEPSRAQLVNYFWQTSSIDNTAIQIPNNEEATKRYLVEVQKRYKLTIRQLQRLMEVFSALTLTWPDPVRKIDALVLLPLVAHYVRGQSLVDFDLDQGAFMKTLNDTTDWRVELASLGSQPPTQSDLIYAGGYIRGQLALSTRTLESVRTNWERQSAESYRTISSDQITQRTEDVSTATTRMEMIQYEKQHGHLRTHGLVSKYAELIQRAGRLSD